ncbi:hypothetical protein FOZ63_026161, partial [Perkinsus olseni]
MSKELVTERVRGELIDHLSKCLRGDRLAAEYLLLHMISRHVSGLGVNDGSRGSGVRDVTACVESLLPRVMQMEVSVGKLNSERWIPTKNYDTDELDSGLLEIARRTYLILDETLLDTGRANVANLRALQLLIRDQKICVQFGPSQIELPTEVNTLTLSASQSAIRIGPDSALTFFCCDAVGYLAYSGESGCMAMDHSTSNIAEAFHQKINRRVRE